MGSQGGKARAKAKPIHGGHFNGLWVAQMKFPSCFVTSFDKSYLSPAHPPSAPDWGLPFRVHRYWL